MGVDGFAAVARVQRQCCRVDATAPRQEGHILVNRLIVQYLHAKRSQKLILKNSSNISSNIKRVIRV